MSKSDELAARPVGDGRYEPLESHLRCVAELAERFAGRFDAGVVGRLAGLLHDIGKAKPEWQRYIRGDAVQVQHSGEGARFAERECHPLFGRALAFAIAGHHGGLPNWEKPGGGRSALKERLCEIEPLEPWFDLGAATDPIELALRFGRSRTPCFAEAFFTRMLFSCLVDADRLASATAEAAAKNETTESGWTGQLSDLKTSLDTHLAGFGAPMTEVEHVRAEVLAACRTAGAEPPGVFSLTVPTGGGKTLSSLAFALEHALAHGMERIVYVIPFTSIVEQTAEVFRGALKDDDAILEHHSGFDEAPPDMQPDASFRSPLAFENWDRPIIVTTAVQFFESLFAASAGRCRKLHRLACSVIILDEAQTIPLKVLRPCLAALDELARVYGASVVLCTATQPAVTCGQGLRAPEALKNVREITPSPEALYGRLRRVTATVAPEKLSDAAIATAMAGTLSALAIVNSRQHAQALFQALKDAGAENARHLSTAMTPSHRGAVLAAIKLDVSSKRPVHVVSTSLIEAGVDISFDAVWRSVAGIDAIAQAAGRCNRNGELGDGAGRLTIFEPEDWSAPRAMASFIETARIVLERHGDPLSLAAVEKYFEELLWSLAPSDFSALDALQVGPTKGVLDAIRATRRTKRQPARTPFSDIAEAFRLIDDGQVPVIVGADASEFGADEELLNTVRCGEKIGRQTTRRLQRHQVQVPRYARARLLNEGALQDLRRNDAPGHFLLLTQLELYKNNRGLCWGEPTALDPESLVF